MGSRAYGTCIRNVKFLERFRPYGVDKYTDEARPNIWLANCTTPHASLSGGNDLHGCEIPSSSSGRDKNGQNRRSQTVANAAYGSHASRKISKPRPIGGANSTSPNDKHHHRRQSWMNQKLQSEVRDRWMCAASDVAPHSAHKTTNLKKNETNLRKFPKAHEASQFAQSRAPFMPSWDSLGGAAGPSLTP